MLLGGHVSVRMPWRDSSPWTRYLFHVFLQRLKRSTFPRAPLFARPIVPTEPKQTGPSASSQKEAPAIAGKREPVPAVVAARVVAPEPEPEADSKMSVSSKSVQSESSSSPAAESNAVASESEKVASAAAATAAAEAEAEATRRSYQMRSRILLEAGDEHESSALAEPFCPSSFLLDAHCGVHGVSSAGPLASAGRIIERLVTVLLRFPHLVAAPVLAHQDL